MTEIHPPAAAPSRNATPTCQFMAWRDAASIAPDKNPVMRIRRMVRACFMPGILALLSILLMATGARAQTCDQTLWQHVYHPQRLNARNACVAVTGTIVDATVTEKKRRKDGVRHEPDGDPHGWLKVDPAFESLLNDGNRKAEQGNLVFEVVCQFKVKQKDAKAACKGFHSSVVIPPVGSHVRITGALVEDDEKAPGHFQWMEIHPVTKIEVIP